MQDELERLSYRSLAERLGISPDAARMKAKRKVATGQWRIIPGNHPSDQVLVELPASELVRSVGWERSGQPFPEQSPRTPIPEQVNTTTDRLLASLSEAISLLRPAQEQIERLHTQLIEAKEAHYTQLAEAKAAHHRDAMELAAAEAREMGTKAELERALADLAVLEQRFSAQKAFAKRRQNTWWWFGR